MRDTFVQASYLLASVFFIIGLKSLSRAETASRGVNLAAVGMLIAIVIALLNAGILSYTTIVVGMLVGGDVLIVISNSGNTTELRAFLRYAASIGVVVIGVASKRDSIVMQNANVRLCLPAIREACPANIAPTTSTTLQLALGDALAMTLMDMRGFSREHMKILHPGGSLGLRLTPVSEIMHGAGRLPLVYEGAPMREVVVSMTSSGFGIAGVVDKADRLIGVITDGDIRRQFDCLADCVAGQVMTRDPKTIPSDLLAEEALHFLNENQITCAFVMKRGAP